MKDLINVYCDESCHLEDRDDHIMVLGAIYCEATQVKLVAERMRQIKEKHGLPRLFETKWTKVSPAKISYYLELIDYFFSESPLRFRALIANKEFLDHEKFKQSHDDWYSKMYYYTLRWIMRPNNRYHFYLDIKDTRGGVRTKKLHHFLAKHILDLNFECVQKVQQIRSNESELLQLADLLIGATGHANRFPNRETAKGALISHIESHLPTKSVSEPSSFAYAKFNLFRWDTRSP